MSESENPAIDAPEAKAHRPRTNKDWWPDQLDLTVLAKHSKRSNPMDPDFDYAEEFKKLDVDALKADIVQVLRTSQDWWPADFGHYGGLMIRLSWHAAGTYRIEDGRGGAGEGHQRFAPLNSWPDNANLDKARRLLWPVKQKYGRKISWADLLVLAGNVALEDMGFETFGFGFGREDVWEPEEIIWGPEDTWLGDERYSGDRELSGPFGAVQMGLIYVNPEGPNGNPDPVAAARDIRETFSRMAMNDEETFALIAGGHTFGKTHGAGDADLVGPEPEGCPVISQGLGWHSQLRLREGSRRKSPAASRSPGPTLRPSGTAASSRSCSVTSGSSPRAPPVRSSGWPRTPRRSSPTPTESPNKLPTMLTTDLSLRFDPVYEKIGRRFLENPEEFRLAFAKAWYKLLHRDMGPIDRYLGPWVAEPQLWQDPVPAVDHELVDDADVAALKQQLLESGLSVSQLAGTAWASAATFRGTDMRGGANGARIRLEPQRSWAVNADAVASLRRTRAGPAGVQRAGWQEDLAGRPDRARGLRGRRAGRAERRCRGHGAVPAGPHRRHAGADRRRLVRRARAAG